MFVLFSGLAGVCTCPERVEGRPSPRRSVPGRRCRGDPEGAHPSAPAGHWPTNPRQSPPGAAPPLQSCASSAGEGKGELVCAPGKYNKTSGRNRIVDEGTDVFCASTSSVLFPAAPPVGRSCFAASPPWTLAQCTNSLAKGQVSAFTSHDWMRPPPPGRPTAVGSAGFLRQGCQEGAMPSPGP